MDCLEIQKIASESINVSVFGQLNSISKIVNIFSFCMSDVSENQKYREKIPINANAVPLICNPFLVGTRRRFNVYKTSYTVYRCLIDVETTSCVYWVKRSSI